MAFLVIFATSTSTGSAQDCAGVWKASGFGVELIAQVKQQGSRLSGIACVYQPSGKLNTYQLYGTYLDGEVKLRHRGGHAFCGRFVSDDHLTGVLTTKDGQTLQFTAARERSLRIDFQQGQKAEE